MSFRSLAIAFSLLLVGAGSARAQDFDPAGRHHHPRAQGHPPAHPSGHAPAAHAPATPAATTAALIERYTKVVLADPGAPFPLQRLAQLYRERDGSLSALVADLTARAATPGTDPYAPTVALAGVAKLDGRPDDAIALYERAIALRATNPTAVLALAHLLQDRGDVAAARIRFEHALLLQTVATEKSDTLHALLTLALDAKDWDGAKRYHVALVRLEPNSRFVRGELGRELYARGEYERAVVELKDAVRAAEGDNRTLAPALKDLGQAQAKAHQRADALATLDRGLAAAGPLAAVRREIYQTITEVYRADQELPVLIKKLEDEHPGDYTRLALLGSLYEETGDAPRALGAYKRALAIDPRQIDLRVKMIRLLQANGELEAAIGAYEGLIRSAPDNPQFVFELCDALLQRGDRVRALRLLTDLEARAHGDEEVLGRLGEFYGRIGEGDRAVHVLARLAEVGGNDPSHLADLGDHYFQEGNTTLAVSTWKRILTTVTPRPRALAALGDIYVEHDLLPDALVVLREAIDLEPQNLDYRKDLAAALERSHSYREASALWESLAEKARAKNDRVLAREVRSHVVTLWALEHALESHVPRLAEAFDADPPDIEAGRTLAEALLHLRRLPETEAALRRVTQLAPGDADGYLALERVLVQEGKLDDAIAVLSRLVQVDPKRARETYQRMAQYALQLYKDQDAITYAARAVELNPDDAEGHRRLGDMYRSRQDPEHAIVEYRAAIAKNDRLFLVYFELADLLMSKGDTDEADRLFRRVLRGAPDEELVSRAARMSMQINLGKGTLASLEQDLVPLAIGNPQKPLYRRLLVEMYGNLTFGLVQRVRHGVGADAADARAALTRVGQRAVKPLLDALSDSDTGQQRIAVDVLGYVASKNAAPTLFGFALGTADTALRVRAMIACGALRDPSLLGRYTAYLLPKGGGELTPTDAVAVAATWGVARMNDPRALPLLRTLAKTSAPDVRALAVLGLGAQGDRSSTPLVRSVLHDTDAGEVARAAAAYALGELGDRASTPLLLTLAEDGDPLARQMALLSLARLGGDKASVAPDALAAMAEAAFAGGGEEGPRARAVSDSLRRAGAAALARLAGGAAEGGPRATDPFPVPDSAVQVEALLTAEVPKTLAAKDGAAVILAFPDVLLRAAATALETSGARARAVLGALAEGNGAFEPFLGPRESAETAAARTRSRGFVRALEPGILALVRHPDPQVRIQALELLAASDSDSATGALLDALSDSSDAVVRVALTALGTHPSHHAPRALEAASRLLAHQTDWSLRVLAAEALGRLGSLDQDTSPARTAAAHDLETAALHDSFALVREAALHALVHVDATDAASVARTLATSDPEPRVQDAARAILDPSPSPAKPL